MILDLFHYNPSALIAGAGVVGLAVGFGAQGLVSDIVTGCHTRFAGFEWFHQDFFQAAL